MLQDSISEQKISPIYPVTRKQMKKAVPLKSSLISSSCEDPQFNQIHEDTILSYFENYEDYESDNSESNDEDYHNDYMGQVARNKGTLRQSEFHNHQHGSHKV